MTTGHLPYGRQSIDEDDIAAVVRVLRSDYLTTGPEVDAFERELADACGARHAVAVSSGTAALHCAYAAAGVGPDDEVVTSPLTFSATANMVLALGGKPVFADVDQTLCLDPRAAERAMTSRTRVIAPVDFAGLPADLDRFLALGRQRGALVIEDAAHSVGARLGNRPIGSIADLTVFSFHPVKTITTAEGGAVLTNDDRLAERARDFRNHGLVRDAHRLTENPGGWYYEVQSLGFNYRLSAIQCALGRSQLRKLGRFVARRTEIVARYRAALAGEERVRFVREPEGVQPAWHLFAIEVQGGQSRRDRLYGALQRQGIGPQVHYILASALPLYRRLGHDPAQTPRARAASQALISLPLYPAMTDADVDRSILALRNALDEIG